MLCDYDLHSRIFKELAKRSFFLPIFLLFFLFFPLLHAAPKPPPLTPHDTKIKIEEILKAHVTIHEITPEIVQRSFQNYLDEIDPGKTYLLKNEILKWLNPSQHLLEETVAQIKRENFSSYEELHETLLATLERRNQIEGKILNTPLPTGVRFSQFKKLDWCLTEEELAERILQIRALQTDAAEKMNQVSKDQFLIRLEKRRLKHQEEMTTSSHKEKQKLILSLVLKSVSSALDSQTLYFTPAEANQFMIQVQQRLFGIGAQLRDDLSGFTIMRLLDGGPAKESNKLRVNDKIIAVNHELVIGMEIIEAVELIRGPKGSSVTLTILRTQGEGELSHEEKIDVEIFRGEVVLKETRLETSYEPFGDGVIGILHLFSFYQDSKTSSALDITAAINDLKKDHRLKGIILDLRGNAGGLLTQAVSVTGLFIKKGIVVSVKDNTGQLQHLRNIDGKVAWDGPLVILTNKTSASAAEIVAQTLQDYGRAAIVGDETTYGKGSFQTFTLESANYGKINPKGEFKVTRGCYYTVSGKSPQLVGVRPDLIVPGIYSEMEIGEKYSKFPLESDQIPPNFEDELSDVPSSHRNQIIKLYKFNLQPRMTLYASYFDTLRKNSAKRIEQNKNYQSFLKEIKSKAAFEEEVSETHDLGDLQLAEAENIMKDLILLLQEEQQLDKEVPAPLAG